MATAPVAMVGVKQAGEIQKVQPFQSYQVRPLPQIRLLYPSKSSIEKDRLASRHFHGPVMLMREISTEFPSMARSTVPERIMSRRRW
jgi:hypothetical protein